MSLGSAPFPHEFGLELPALRHENRDCDLLGATGVSPSMERPFGPLALSTSPFARRLAGDFDRGREALGQAEGGGMGDVAAVRQRELRRRLVDLATSLWEPSACACSSKTRHFTPERIGWMSPCASTADR